MSFAYGGSSSLGALSLGDYAWLETGPDEKLLRGLYKVISRNKSHVGIIHTEGPPYVTYTAPPEVSIDFWASSRLTTSVAGSLSPSAVVLVPPNLEPFKIIRVTPTVVSLIFVEVVYELAEDRRDCPCPKQMMAILPHAALAFHLSPEMFLPRRYSLSELSVSLKVFLASL